ncbi:MAG: T9SS type A sorting domain-containing protein, partial [Saprospiraceae bacterium]|nr:T9SS type A sorting domain-containing protein [Saprospiraceae bacterium]
IQNGLLCAYAQPIFSKISFASDGSIIVGLMDRWAHQLGHHNFSTVVNDRTLLIGYACGDILKAFNEGNGNYNLEKTNADDGVYYRKDDGPSYNGEFFYEDNYISSLAHHGEVITGGMLILPGSDEIAATVHNPRVTRIPYFEFEGLFSQGLHFYNTNTGKRTRDYLFVDQYILGKANGLGDMTVATAAAPPSVGNYVWCDANANGIQDPTEFGINGIRIVLQDAENALAMVDEQVTANGGQYFFDDLLPNHCYEMKINLDDLVVRGFSGSASPLNAADSLIDSDANDTIVPGWAIIAFCTGNDGLNRDDLDFGFLGPEASDGTMVLCEDISILPLNLPCVDFPLADVRALASEAPNTNVRIYPSFNAADSMLNEITTPIRVCGPDSTVFARVMVNGDPQCHSISQILLVVQPGIGGAPVDFTELICPTDPFNLLLYLQDQGFRGDATSEFYTDPMHTMMFMGDPAAVNVMGTLPLTLYYDDTLVAGGCGVQGSVTLNAIPTSLIFAGSDTTICGLSCVDLTTIGAVFNPNGSGAMDAIWSSSGSGEFIDDNSFALARLYCVSQEDLETGQVILTLTVTDDPCISPAPASSVVITITNPPPTEIPAPRDTIDCYHPFAVDPIANDTFPGCRLLVNCVDTLVGQVVDYDYLVGDCRDIVLQIKRTLKFTYDKQDYFCMDTISVRGLPDTLICPPEKDSVYCVPGYLKDENGHPSPFVTGVPMADSIPLWPQPPSACDILIHYKDLAFPGQCPMTIRREWFIKNTCTGDFDTCTQWIMVFDTTGPVITKLDTAAFYVPIPSDSHGCSADVYVPPIMLEDTCTGVKQVKAMVDRQVVVLDYNAQTGYYESHKKIKLPVTQLDFIGGASVISYVRYEAIDSCHNKTILDSLPLLIVDASKPVAICDKGINLTVSDSLIWVPATVFDESSWDNCGIAILMARRTDWATACGVDLCDDIQYLTRDAHHDSLFYARLQGDPKLNKVEAHYQQAIDWLCADGRECTYPLLLGWAYDLIKEATLNCREHPYPVDAGYLKQLISSVDEGDFNSVITALIPCLDLVGDSVTESAYEFSDSHYNLIARLFSDSLTMALANRRPPGEALLDIGKQIGGGWSSAVPFCCEDACQSVMVEVLAMDYWCNWSKCWTTVYVEDKTPPKVISDLYDVTVSCSGYQSYYAEAVEMAQLGQYDSLQRLLGSYDQVHLDKYGKVADKTSFKIIDLNCDSTLVKRDSLIYDEHLGYRWETFRYYRAHYDTLIKTHFNGQVADDCGLQIIEEKPWVSIDACGNGFVKRVFKFVGQCTANGSIHKADTIKRMQTIWIRLDCDISKAMFEVPQDTLIEACELIYVTDGSGKVAGLAAPSSTGVASYIFESDCRQIGIGYYDKVFRIVGGKGCYKILRTWCFADWCSLGGIPASKEWWWDPQYSGKYLNYTQKIIIQDTVPPSCHIDLPAELIAIGCQYDLDARVDVEDGCGKIDYSWRVMDTKSQVVVGSGSGIMASGDQFFSIKVPDVLPGSYRLKVIMSDDCQNESVCDHQFTIIAGKKPTPVCLSSLTVDLTPMDLNADGVNDTAMAVVWADEFNQSSTAACGSKNADLVYRIDFDQGEPVLPAKDRTKLDLGCAHTGVQTVRLYVLDPNGNWDYCTLILIVQDNNKVCGEIPGKRLQESLYATDILSKAEKNDGQKQQIRLKSGDVFPAMESGFVLFQNSPNPFLRITRIGFSITEAANEATLSIHDISGRLIDRIKGKVFPGYQEWQVDLPPQVQGILYYKLETPDGTLVRKMIKM